ncbi:cation:proton antiporter [Haliangium ochraceum]|uniref:Sodium/hydrogen exchanger n=1 Tax=Haliangium ochraceum (strain DSM 14365 / JCM 11303 / SMP-2) TaxID=502025 RepID=D0LH42_HALO1|nr:cation:proton antiporter [Haliangium ochraceum]ACY18187.1 sodium/hydrogen exchanger [Haliangium ochraceum DSM 14365]
MGHIPLIDEIAIIAGLGVLVTLILARLRLPTVAGLLFAGGLAGPFGFGLVRSIHDIEMLAEVGVVLLLFTIGLEFSLARLKNIFRQVALGGIIQVGATAAAAGGIAMALGEPLGRCIFYGFLFALSSTAIVLRGLAERRELDAPHGRFIVGTLIFQDLCVVPMVLVVPMLAPGAAAGEAWTQIGWALGKAALVVAAVLVLARLLVPRFLGWVDASRSREVFVLAVIGLCIGTAWLTAQAGLSLALGAFLGGMVVADTEYGHRAMGDMLPLRDTFMSIFFVSLGMLFDIRVVAERPMLVGLLLLGFIFAKGLLATIAALAMRFPARVAWLAGVGLAQFGEFGFVLARLGESSGVVSGEALAPLFAAGIASMFLTPVLVRVAPHVTAGERLLAPLERLLGARGIDESDAQPESLTGHVVVVGYGVAGRLVAGSLKHSGIPSVVLELNAETVRAARANGEQVFYGDATSSEALGHAHVERARAVVLLINDPHAARRVVGAVKHFAPDVPVFMRAHYLAECDALQRAGASVVVAEEIEGGLELLARLLGRLAVPRNVIDTCVAEARATSQLSERDEVAQPRGVGDHPGLAEMSMESVLLAADSPAVGRSAVELSVRTSTGALIVALRREGALREYTEPSAAFQTGDIVYFMGKLEAVQRAVALFTEPDEPAADDAAPAQDAST